MNNYTKNITFARARKNPIYMRTLKAIIDHPNGIDKLNVMRITHPHYGLTECAPTPDVNNGPFAMLTHYNLVTIERRNRKCFYKPTQCGIEFYHNVMA